MYLLPDPPWACRGHEGWSRCKSGEGPTALAACLPPTQPRWGRAQWSVLPPTPCTHSRWGWWCLLAQPAERQSGFMPMRLEGGDPLLRTSADPRAPSGASSKRWPWAELSRLRAAAANVQVPGGPAWSWAVALCRSWPDGRGCLGSARTVWGPRATGSPRHRAVLAALSHLPGPCVTELGL